MEWREIETAPKDGTRVMLNHNGAIVIGFYDDMNFMGWTLDRSTYIPDVKRWMPLPIL